MWTSQSVNNGGVGGRESATKASVGLTQRVNYCNTQLNTESLHKS